MTDRFPEIADAAAFLPDGTVLDGEVMPWRDGAPLPFAQLQRRIGRKSLGAKILSEVPVVLVVYDLLEVDGRDVRDGDAGVATRADAKNSSPTRAARRSFRRRSCRSRSGPTRATRIRPRARDERRGIDAQAARRRVRRGASQGRLVEMEGAAVHGGRGDDLRAGRAMADARRCTPTTRSPCGRTARSCRSPKRTPGSPTPRSASSTRGFAANTVEKFGPVRHVKPEHVFELGFEGIQASPRHKSGVAVRFPRILAVANGQAAGGCGHDRDVECATDWRVILRSEATGVSS